MKSSEPLPAFEPKPTLTSEYREVLVAFVVIALAVAITAHLLPGPIQQYAYSIVLAAMVYLPVMRGDRRRRPLEQYGITFKGWKSAVLIALLCMAIVFPIFIFGNHIWKAWIFGKSFSFALPEKALLAIWFEQTILIALPEEFFYRGWMQSVMLRRWTAKRKILGAGFGIAIVFTSLLFAIGHLAAIPSPFRLAVFFPSLLFGWLRVRTGSLIAPILVHGASNLLMSVLVASYH